MKANKYIFLSLAFSLIFANNTGFANEDINKSDSVVENFYEATDLSDIISKEKERLLEYISEIKNSSNYIKSSDEIKSLYDNSIEFNSRSLQNEDSKWLAYSYDRLKGDIDLIEKLANGIYRGDPDINQNSIFLSDPSYIIAYLKLDKEKQDILDELIKNIDNQVPLEISDFKDLDDNYKLLFYSDWLYPFVEDKDKDGIISTDDDLVEKIKKDKALFEKYRKTKIEERFDIENDQIDDIENTGTGDEDIKTYQNQVSNNEYEPSENENLSPDDQTEIRNSDNSSENIFMASSQSLDEQNSNINQGYSSMFYKNNRTRDFYTLLNEEQRDELDKLDTDGDGVLSVEEIEKSPKYHLPITKEDWIYPFMLDKNEDGLIDESDKTQDIYVYENTEEKNDLSLTTQTHNENGANENLPIEIYSSDFYKNDKTREAYLALTDEQRKTLDEINTDNKYPLTIEEVINSGKYTIPVYKDEWLYPFMIDRNKNGQVGENYYGNTDTTNTNNPSTQISDYTVIADPQVVDTPTLTSPQNTDNTTLTSQPETVNITESAQATTNTSSITNVKTGIKGLRPLIVVLLIASIAYYILKKNKNKNI